MSLEILHTPGHTPGGISIVSDGAIFTGDLILSDGTQAMKLEETDEAASVNSVRVVISPRAANRATTIYPGHGESFRFQGI